MPQPTHITRNLFSLLHKHQNCRPAIQQVHSRFVIANSTLLKVWNSILKHYSLGKKPHEAVILFRYLKNRENSVMFDSFTYAYLVKACANLKGYGTGNQVHCLSFKVGFRNHVYVGTALVNMYVECGFLTESKRVFDEMDDRNLVTWNVLLTGFVKWGRIEYARGVFDVMPEKNVVSWTGIIDGYTRAGQFHEALSLFQGMVVHEGIKVSEVTLLAIFPAIWNVGCLEFCQVLHAYVEKSGFSVLDIRVRNCLIDAYAKCGSIDSAKKVFDEMVYDERNLVTWTSIISGFAMHGMAVEASYYYKRMEDGGLKPNRVTLLSVLNACSHGGLVDHGLELYKKIVDGCEIELDIKHYGCLIDMLGRAGRLEEAEKIALSIPSNIANAVAWRTLLGACSFHGDVEMGERITKKIMEIESEYGGDYVLLSNIFAGSGRYMDSERVRSEMDIRHASKVHGLSLV